MIFTMQNTQPEWPVFSQLKKLPPFYPSLCSVELPAQALKHYPSVTYGDLPNGLPTGVGAESTPSTPAFPSLLPSIRPPAIIVPDRSIQITSIPKIEQAIGSTTWSLPESIPETDTDSIETLTSFTKSQDPTIPLFAVRNVSEDFPPKQHSRLSVDTLRRTSISSVNITAGISMVLPKRDLTLALGPATVQVSMPESAVANTNGPASAESDTGTVKCFCRCIKKTA